MAEGMERMVRQTRAVTDEAEFTRQLVAVGAAVETAHFGQDPIGFANVPSGQKHRAQIVHDGDLQALTNISFLARGDGEQVTIKADRGPGHQSNIAHAQARAPSDGTGVRPKGPVTV